VKARSKSVISAAIQIRAPRGRHGIPGTFYKNLPLSFICQVSHERFDRIYRLLRYKIRVNLLKQKWRQIQEQKSQSSRSNAAESSKCAPVAIQ
jgi:hypothetical protein